MKASTPERTDLSPLDETTPPEPLDESTRELGLIQALLYGTGGIAGGLLFTMMNNALPLFLGGYRMPLGLPAFLSPGRQVPATIVALLTNERSLLGGLIQPFVGQLSDRTRSPIGKRSPFLLVGGLGAALCISSLALEPPFWLMVAAITLAGMFLYVAVGPYNSLLADIAPFEQRGRLGGLIAFAGVVGALAFTLISVLFWDTARGWVFILTGAGVLVSLWIVAVGVHEPPSTAMHLPQAHERATRLWQEVLRDHRLALYIASMGTYWVAAGAASPFITRFGVIELHVSESNSFLLLLPLVIASAVGAVVAGYLADRFERKQILHYSLILFSAAVIAASLVRDLAQAIPVMVVVGLCNGSLTALQVPLLADMVPRARAGAFMGFASMIWSLAQPVGSVIAGLLVDISGSYRGVFFFSGVVMFISMLILRRVKSSRADT